MRYFAPLFSGFPSPFWFPLVSSTHTPPGTSLESNDAMDHCFVASHGLPRLQEPYTNSSSGPFRFPRGRARMLHAPPWVHAILLGRAGVLLLGPVPSSSGAHVLLLGPDLFERAHTPPRKTAQRSSRSLVWRRPKRACASGERSSLSGSSGVHGVLAINKQIRTESKQAWTSFLRATSKGGEEGTAT